MESMPLHEPDPTRRRMSLKSSLDSHSRVVRIHSHWLNPETPPRTTRPSRGLFCWPLFSRGLSPVETILGASQGSGRRIGLNHVLRKGTLPHREKRGTKGLRERLP